MTNINPTDLKVRFDADLKERFDAMVEHVAMARQQLKDAEQAYFDYFHNPGNGDARRLLYNEYENAKTAYDGSTRMLSEFILMYKDAFEVKSLADPGVHPCYL